MATSLHNKEANSDLSGKADDPFYLHLYILDHTDDNIIIQQIVFSIKILSTKTSSNINDNGLSLMATCTW